MAHIDELTEEEQTALARTGTREWTALCNPDTGERLDAVLRLWKADGGDRPSDQRVSDEYLAASGIYGFIETPLPRHDPATQKCVEGTPVRDDEAHTCTQVWRVVELEPEEADEVLANKVREVLVECKRRLRESDWSQTDDNVRMRDEEWLQAWVDYRKALRVLYNEVEIGAADPFKASWPREPG